MVTVSSSLFGVPDPKNSGGKTPILTFGVSCVTLGVSVTANGPFGRISALSRQTSTFQTRAAGPSAMELAPPCRDLVALHGDYKKTAKCGLVSPACIGSPRTV